MNNRVRIYLLTREEKEKNKKIKIDLIFKITL